MKKTTAKAEQFFARSGNDSTKGSRKGFSLLGGGVDPSSVLSEDQRHHNEVAAARGRLHHAESELAEAKAEMHANFGMGDSYFKARMRKDQALANKNEAVAELTALKKKRTADTSLSVQGYFIEVCRERLTKAQFALFMSIAIKRAQDALGKSDDAASDEPTP